MCFENNRGVYAGGSASGRAGPGVPFRPGRPYNSRPTDAPGLVCTCTCYLHHGPLWTAVYYRRKALYCAAVATCVAIGALDLEASPSSKSTIADGVQRRRRLRRAVPLFPVLTLGRAKATR